MAQTPPPAAARSGLRIATLIFGLVGVLLWWVIGAGRGIGWIRWMLIATSAAVACLPPVCNIIAAGLDRIRRPSPRAVRRTALVIWLIASGYFVLTAINQDRDLFPKTHDDCSYAIGVQMLAHGRLWEPAPAVPEFFDSFYLLVRPVYCSLYFPGTALLYVPTVWLHLPFWAMPALASGAVTALMYLLVTELINGAAGLLAALMVVSLSWFRVYSVLLTSHVPMLLMGLLLFWAFLHWRKQRQLRWAMAMGIFAGWAAITRPADAVVFALPVGVVLLIDVMRRRDWRSLLSPLVIVAAAGPFLCLQVVFNFGVTGRAMQAPYTYYLEQDQPGSSFGFHPYNPGAQPQSTLLQKRENYDRWVRDYLIHHTPGQLANRWRNKYLPQIADVTMPCRLMLVFMMVGLLGLTEARRLSLWITFPIFLIVYALNPFFLEHYAILIIPASILATLLGAETLIVAWPSQRRQIASAFVAILVMACVTSLWEVNRFVATKHAKPATAFAPAVDGNEVDDETFKSDYLRNIHLYLADLVDQPAVVLFTYHTGGNYFEEPVYNTDVAQPDDAPIIRAHDLGPTRNRELFAYYGRTQPDRIFYIFDWSLRASKDGPLQRLGSARELAAQIKR